MAKPAGRTAGGDISVTVAGRKPGIHYAWYVLLSAVAMSSVGAGLGFYSYSAFFKPWETEFGWSRGQVSSIMALSSFVAGFFGPLLGRWIDRYGPRMVAAIGATVMGGSYLAMTATGVFPLSSGVLALPYLTVMFMVMTLGRWATTFITLNATLANWFVKDRGLAMGVMAAGFGLGGVIITPLLTLGIETIGWRAAFVIGALSVWIVLLSINAFVLRNRPSDKGLMPYGYEQIMRRGEHQVKGAEVADGAPAGVDYRWGLGESLRTPSFWYLSLGVGFFFFGNSIAIQHAIPFFVEKGNSLTAAAGFLSGIAACGVVGKVLLGVIADRLPSARFVFIACLIFEGMGAFILLVSNSVPLYWLGVVVLGMAMGGAVTLQAVMVTECFGIASFGIVFGAMQFVSNIFGSLSPLYAGLTHDLTGDYQVTLISVVIFSFAGGITLFFARPARPSSSVAPTFEGSRPT